MSDLNKILNKKRKKSFYTFEDFGGVTPEEPRESINRFESELLGLPQHPMTLRKNATIGERLSEDMRDIPSIRIDKPEEPKVERTRSEEALIQIENMLSSTGLYNTGIGDVAREIGTPILTGINRMQEAGQQPVPDLGGGILGLGEAGFGALMSPFTSIKMGTEAVAGETAGTVAELGSLAATGGIPLVVGYLVSQGADKVAEKVAKGLDLSPKDEETFRSALGITSFVAGTKGGQKLKTIGNKFLSEQVTKGIDIDISRPTGRGEVSDVFKDTGKTTGKGKPISKDPKLELERKLDREKIEPIEKIVTKAKEKGKEIDLTVFKELDLKDKGRKQRYEDLYKESLKYNKEIKEKKVEKPIEPLFEEPKTPTRRDRKKQELFDENKKVIKEILDDDPSLSSSPRQISKKLNSLVEQGKLKNKISIESIKDISKEWIKNRPKPKVQEIKPSGEPNPLGLKIPKEENTLSAVKFDKNTGWSIEEALKQNPDWVKEVKDLKTGKEVADKINQLWNEKRDKVKTTKISETQKPDTPTVVETGKTKTPKETKVDWGKQFDTVFDEIFGSKEQSSKVEGEALNRIKRRRGEIKSLLDPADIKDMLIIAGSKFNKGARTFAEFSKEMIETVGEDIKPHLKDIYDGLGKVVKINDKPIKEWIEGNKQFLGLELKETKGMIIDPNTGLEGAARHKPKRSGGIIEYNENTQGTTWYHELAHSINNKIRENAPNFLEEYKGDITKLIGESKKGLNEQFADAFVEMFTNPNAPRTKLQGVIQRQFDTPIPKVNELVRQKRVELERPKEDVIQTGKGLEGSGGKRVEKSYEWLEDKYDAPKEVNQVIYESRKTDAYKKLRDDGTDTWADAYERSKEYTGITEQTLLTGTLPKDYVFNKAQQIRIEQIASNKALEVVEMRKGMDKNLSTSQAQQLSNAVKNLISLQAISKNNLREAARVMESAKRKHKMSPEEYEKVQKIASEIDKIEGTNTVESIKQIDKTLDYTATDGVSRALYEFMLSNPLTQLANIGGNLTHLTWELGTQMLINPIQTTKGFFRGIRIAPRETAKVLTGEKQAISKYTSDMNLKQDIISPKTKLGNVIYRTLTPSQALQYQDVFFRTIGESIREQQVAKRLSKEYKTTPERIRNILEDILEKGDSRDVLVTERGLKEWTKEVDAIEAYARRVVFQQPLGKTGRAAQTFLNQPMMLPIKFLAMPFMRIAVNLTKTSLDNSPIALARGLKLDRKTGLKFSEKYKNWTKEEKTDFYRRMIAGTAFLSGLMKLVDDGVIDITGDGHTIPPTTKELLYETGYKENSIIIKSGGKEYVIPYDNISPFNIVLGGLGGLIEMSKYNQTKPEDEENWDKAWQDALGGMISLANGLSNQSFLQGTSNLISTLERGDSKLLERSLVRLSTPNIFSLFKGSADFGEGANIYKIESILDAVQDRMALGNGLETMFFTIDPLDKKTNIFGEEKLSKYRRFPIPREKESKEIAEFLLRNNQGIGKPRNPHINGEPIYTEKEYDKWVDEYKRQLHKFLNENLSYLKDLERQEGGDRVIEKMIDGLKNLSKEMAKQELNQRR